MEKAHCSKGKFFEKDLVNPVQVNEPFLPLPP